MRSSMVATEKPNPALLEDMYEAARILASGYTVERMRQEGYDSEANQFSLLLEILVENELIDQTYALRDKIVKYLNGSSQPIKPAARPARKSSTPHNIQENFFYLDDLANPAEPSPAWLQQQIRDPEANINHMHRIFQGTSRQDEYDRGKLLSSEAARDWRQFLKAIGVPTKGQKQEQLTQKANEYIAFLKAIGVWDDIRGGQITQKVLTQIKEALEYPPRYDVDRFSSESVTIFNSEEAMTLQRLLDAIDA